MQYNRRFTGTVTAPIKQNQVFVFNSYSNGINKAGTAKAALLYFGAKPGIGEGPSGQSYAIPSEVPSEKMHEAISRFIDYAREHTELEFLVTPIGIGKIFNRDPIEVANMFAEALPLENVILPEQFVEILVVKGARDAVHDIGPKDPVNYKLIDHGGACDFNESAVIKQEDGKYILAGLGNMEMGGSWSGFFYFDSMQGFDSVLLAVIPKGEQRFSMESQFVQSCVIVRRNNNWGCISTRCGDYSRVVVPIMYKTPDEVKEKLKTVSHCDISFVWKSYEEYIRATEYVEVYPNSRDRKIEVFVGDITKVKADAIVNAANTTLLGGGGIDGAIHHAAGPQLYSECKKLGGCKVGESKMTNAYNLPCKKIIHTVGPDLRKLSDIGEAIDLLKNCYKTVLDIAAENGLESVVFCCISTGIYCFPKPLAARIALYTIDEHPYQGAVSICCFTPEDKSYYDILMR